MTAPAVATGVAAEQSLSASATAFYALLASLSANAAQIATGMWDELDPSDLLRAWIGLSLPDRLLVTTAVSQRAAAASAQDYVGRAVRAQAERSEGDPVNLESLVGIASDGRDLDDLLFSPMAQSLQALGQGATGEQAKATGRAALATIVETQVADTGRATSQVAMVADRQVTGYVRMLTPPSCGRCAVLAGRVYRWSSGFNRHERCDCVHIPAVEDAPDDLRTDPDAYFHSLDAADQNRYFGKAEAEAIRQGADIGQVVNARRGARGLSQPGRLTAAESAAVRKGRPARLERVDVYGRKLAVTTEGSTRRGLAGQRLIAAGSGTERGDSRYQRAKTPRLMPDGILELAGGDREVARDLLYQHGYLLAP